MTQDILDTITFDDEGFMVDASVWTEEIAQAIGDALEVKLSDRHWEVIKYARQEYETQGEPPTLRRITQQTDVSIPGGPAKIAANIAGLKKPTGCI